MKRYLSTDNDRVNFYGSRCELRETKLMSATMDFVDYFISLGDDEIDAKNKVSQLSTEINPMLYGYVLGNVQPLLESIENSTLSFMDENAKSTLIGYLTI
jgi:hypothetical protein